MHMPNLADPVVQVLAELVVLARVSAPADRRAWAVRRRMQEAPGPLVLESVAQLVRWRIAKGCDSPRQWRRSDSSPAAILIERPASVNRAL